MEQKVKTPNKSPMLERKEEQKDVAVPKEDLITMQPIKVIQPEEKRKYTSPHNSPEDLEAEKVQIEDVIDEEDIP